MEITIGKKQYIKSKALKIVQKGVCFYVGTIKASDMLNISTVEPLIYDKKSFTYSGLEIDEISNDDVLRLIRKEKESDFQRIEDEKRVSKIKKFLLDEEYALFPNTIITAAKFKNSYLEEIQSVNSLSGNHLQRFLESPGVFYSEEDCSLIIPKDEAELLVIDGQHRLLGLAEMDSSFSQEYDVLVAFLLGFEKPVLAQQFYTINYEQKTVDRSMLEQLKNSFSDDLNEDKVIHEFIRALNEIEKSPFYCNIRMLGKGEGIVSQAFMKDMLMPLVMPLSKRSPKIPIFRYHFVRDEYGTIINALLRYFVACQKVLDGEERSWWSEGTTVFTKTIGVGALIRIIPYVILSILDHKNELNDLSEIGDIKVVDYEGVLANLSEINVQKYQNAGSYGMIKVLAEELIEACDLDDYTKDQIASKSLNWFNELYY